MPATAWFTHGFDTKLARFIYFAWGFLQFLDFSAPGWEKSPGETVGKLPKEVRPEVFSAVGNSNRCVWNWIKIFQKYFNVTMSLVRRV